MIRITLFFLTLLLFSACSFKSPPNDWQYKSVSAFESYTKNFLSANDTIAKNDLKRAIEHAKQGADIKTLSHIYLAKCALNISVGVNDECKEYQNISALVSDAALEAYFNFIQKKESYDIDKLDASYHNFATSLNDKEKLNESILKISNPTSKLLAAALAKDNLTQQTREAMINVASFNGYKKSTLFWLNEKLLFTKDESEMGKLIKMIEILTARND